MAKTTTFNLLNDHGETCVGHSSSNLASIRDTLFWLNSSVRDPHSGIDYRLKRAHPCGSPENPYSSSSILSLDVEEDAWVLMAAETWRLTTAVCGEQLAHLRMKRRRRWPQVMNLFKSLDKWVDFEISHQRGDEEGEREQACVKVLLSYQMTFLPSTRFLFDVPHSTWRSTKSSLFIPLVSKKIFCRASTRGLSTRREDTRDLKNCLPWKYFKKIKSQTFSLSHNTLRISYLILKTC